MCKMIALVGAMASGKDTLFRNVCALTSKATPLISTTSRPMRNGEKEGREYNFVSKEEMNKMLNEDKFVEVRAYNVATLETWYYGLEKDSIDLNSNNTYIVIVDIEGLKKIKKYLSENGLRDNLVSVFVDCSAHIRMQRALSREGKMTDEQIKEICRRNISDMDFVVKYKNECLIKLKNETYKDSDYNEEFLVNLINAISEK